MPCPLALAIKTFHISGQSIPLSAYVACPTTRHFVTPSSIFSHCYPILPLPSIIAVVTKCSGFTYLITWAKNGCLAFSIFYV